MVSIILPLFMLMEGTGFLLFSIGEEIYEPLVPFATHMEKECIILVRVIQLSL